LLLGFYEPFDDILGWKQIIGFIAASMVSSFIYEIARQNIPLLKQIGRAGRYPCWHAASVCGLQT